MLHYANQANLASELSGEAQACEGYEDPSINLPSPCQRSRKQALTVAQTLSGTRILKSLAPKGPHKVLRH